MQYNLYFCNHESFAMKVDLVEKASQLRQIIDNCQKIVTVSHTHPDGDAIGSSIATACWCESLGKQVTCLFPDALPETLEFMIRPERKDKILIHSRQREQAETALRECDAIIALDFPDFGRTESLASVLKSSPKSKIQIDHHLNPAAEQFSLSVSESEVSSASELSYQLLKVLVDGGFGAFSLEACEAFMTGMTTDTNNFSNSTWPSTLKMASELLEAGVNRNKIVENLNCHFGENRLRVLGKLLSENMTVTPEGAAYMVLYKKDRDEAGLKDGDTEGFVNIPLAIGNVKISCFLKEDDGHFRVSLRSKAGTSAARCAGLYFHGGGHENASGGKLYFPSDIESPGEAEAFLSRIMKEFLLQ